MNKRTVKSFVLRGGRISNRQQHALSHYLASYRLPLDKGLWQLEKIFQRQADTILEIGFGMGDSLLAMAKMHPELNFIGVEVHQAGIGSLVAALHENNLPNVRIAPYDITEILSYLPSHSLWGVQIFFPDPWPKKRHHKRRLIQKNFISSLTDRLLSKGFIHCATDWQDYAEHIADLLSNTPQLSKAEDGELRLESNKFSPCSIRRPSTKFEQRGKNLGHAVWDIIFKKI